MPGSARTNIGPVLAVMAVTLGISGCNTGASVLTTGSIADRKPPVVVSDAERDCLGRATQGRMFHRVGHPLATEP